MATLESLLDASRRELLDLSARNRLLSMPVESKSARTVRVHDERSDNVFRQLVREHKTLSFLPVSEDGFFESSPRSPIDGSANDGENVGLPQPDEDIDGETRRHTDLKLQTTHSSEVLQRRLLGLYHDSQAIIEEQGVNILYLAIGRLKWFEADKADSPRFAPLILVPVQLHRKSARDRFALTWREEEVQENLSLYAKLETDFGIKLPEFPDEEEVVPSQYAHAVARAVSGQPQWEVEPDSITLGFFSFAKFLMYRDLDPKNWPTPESLLTPTLGGLLKDGFPASIIPFAEDSNLDEIVPASRLDHVVDADSSQATAIESVRAGVSVVVQGPPGTGKSQSITNIIAAAVLDGKRVLFVAEKLAALEVVKRRLEAAGLGDLCLELHSHKANKRTVLEELGRTWQLGKPRGYELEQLVPRLEQSRARLNSHVAILHGQLGSAGMTPFRVIGQLALLGDRGRDLGDLEFDGANTWSSDALRERRAVVSELVSRVEQMGTPNSHPWRGAERQTILNIDLPIIRERLIILGSSLSKLRIKAHEIAELLRRSDSDSLPSIDHLRTTAKHVASAPTLDASALRHGVWKAGLTGLHELVEHGRSFTLLDSTLGSRINQSAYEVDLSGVRNVVATHGKSLFRVLRGEYRSAVRALRNTLVGVPPKDYEERLGLLDDLIAARAHLLAVRTADEIGAHAFGDTWKGEHSNWEQLSAIVDWVEGENQANVGPDFHNTYADLDLSRDFDTLADELSEATTRFRQDFQTVVDLLSLNIFNAFGSHDVDNLVLGNLVDRLDEWLRRLEDLTRWNTWYTCAVRARQLGLGAIVDSIESGELPAPKATDVFERAYCSQLLREAVRTKPELGQFDGITHDRLVEEFRRIDTDRLSLAKYRVLARHYEGIPSRHASAGTTGILLGELERKRGHRPIRKLLKDAGSVVQSLKPVFMMSPLSVAQYLEPGGIEFDLLVIDEASQVQPVDALGAFARAKQFVVVGDSKQLPPTRFFTRLTSNSDGDGEPEDEDVSAAQAKDVESILGLCTARGIPQTMLRWHYRSRHHSLIAVSNREFYEDKLFIVPSPHLDSDGLGLRFRFVEGGSYDRGHSGTNRVEARIVCRAVLDHARANPELTLGVAAFSMRQQQAILDELELMRREQPDVEAFFHAHPFEPIFVKNLENVQGDERDVILISVGFGPDPNGYVAMNFGPLNSDGGERRLNVLISRARQRCEVFSSIRAADIDLARAPGRGVRALKSFLDFAETGRLKEAARSTGDEMSPFEEAVRVAIEGLGFEAHPQIGVAGFFVDLGVLDPQKPGRYVLGVECDGATYHSARSARDRDRLRQSILEDHGWIIHRIWSTDWFQRPSEQLRKLSSAIEHARVALSSARVEHPRVETPDDIGFEREVEPETVDELSIPYAEARFNVPLGVMPHELATKRMSEVLFQIVQVEGPVHEDELIARVRDLWQLGRAGSRIQDSVVRGVRALLVSGQCQREDSCLYMPNAPVPVRNRESVQSASLRKPEHLPPLEIRAAIEQVVVAHHGANERDIIMTVSRMLGFKATSGALRELIQSQISTLVSTGKLIQQDGLFKLATSN